MTTDVLVHQCEGALHADGLFGLLRALNATTAYRFTGIYRFEGEWVRSVWLYDRTRPDVQFGSDVRWDASYCRITATDGGACEIANALADARLRSHAAREVVQSYLGVVLHMPASRPSGRSAISIPSRGWPRGGQPRGCARPRRWSSARCAPN